MKLKIKVEVHRDLKDENGKILREPDGGAKYETVLEDREIDIIGLKGKHQKKFLNIISKAVKGSGNLDELSHESINQIMEVLEYIDSLITEVTDLTEEEVIELDLTEKNKITKEIMNILSPWRQEGFF